MCNAIINSGTFPYVSKHIYPNMCVYSSWDFFATSISPLHNNRPGGDAPL